MIIPKKRMWLFQNTKVLKFILKWNLNEIKWLMEGFLGNVAPLSLTGPSKSSCERQEQIWSLERELVPKMERISSKAADSVYSKGLFGG